MFTLDIIVGDQSIAESGQGPFYANYKVPVVWNVDSNVSTRGNESILVQGVNFGSSLDVEGLGGTGSPLGEPEYSVWIGRDDEIGMQECSNPMRMSHTAIQCIVPEGSGGNLDVEVRVSGRIGKNVPDASFSYASPLLSSVELYHDKDLVQAIGYGGVALEWDKNATKLSPWRTGRVADLSWSNLVNPSAATVRQLSGDRTIVVAPSEGSTEVVLRGENFGPPRTAAGIHCIFVSYLGRYALGPLPVCDGLESFSGEGEIFHDGTLIGSRMR